MYCFSRPLTSLYFLQTSSNCLEPTRRVLSPNTSLARFTKLNTMLAAIIAVVMEVPAAILIVLGFFTRPLAVLFIFYTLGTAVIGHHYWDMAGDAVGPNMINFWKNVSIAGAFLLLAITGPGAISLDRR